MAAVVSTRSALVVGGSGGIGLAVARGCAEESLGVTLVARRADRLERAARSLGQAVRVTAMVADAASPVALERAVAEHERAHGGLDLVVVATGGGRPGTAVHTAPEEVARAVDRELGVPWQVFRSTVTALRDRAARNGVARFVVVGSVAGIVPVPGYAAYSAAKAAVRSLVLTVERDEGAAGLRATVIEPGYVATPLTEPVPIAPENMLEPDDVAHAVRFLLHLSPQASVTELVLGRAGAGTFAP
jgi:NADP-dependent 3-hydroxy acid dehydrogenase YdfG